MDKNLVIHIDVLVREEHDWDFGSSKVQITLPSNHIGSMSFEEIIGQLIDEAYINQQEEKEKKNEDTERDSSSTDEE